MVVMRYEVVSQEMVFAALKSEPITAYVEAVMVPSKPERNTLLKIAKKISYCTRKALLEGCTYLNPDKAWSERGRRPVFVINKLLYSRRSWEK